MYLVSVSSDLGDEIVESFFSDIQPLSGTEPLLKHLPGEPSPFHRRLFHSKGVAHRCSFFRIARGWALS